MNPPTLDHLRHQQLRTEIAAWAALILALLIYQHEATMQAIKHQAPNLLNLHLLTLACAASLAAFYASFKLKAQMAVG